MKKFFRPILVLFVLILLLAMGACKKQPSLVEQRKTEIRVADSLELLRARVDLAVMDSIVTVRALEVEGLKRQFVFEKQERYQTIGYYVLPPYQGDKSRFHLFPEVEENGALLLVSIDENRQYSFSEIRTDQEIDTALLPQGLSEAMKADVLRCYALAQSLHALKETRHQQEKQALKVRFYERKLGH